MCISSNWQTRLQPHYMRIWRLAMKRLFQEVPCHSSLLERTWLWDIANFCETQRGQFSHWDCAFLKINLQLITYRPAVNMHETYNYSISLLPGLFRHDGVFHTTQHHLLTSSEVMQWLVLYCSLEVTGLHCNLNVPSVCIQCVPCFTCNIIFHCVGKMSGWTV